MKKKLRQLKKLLSICIMFAFFCSEIKAQTVQIVVNPSQSANILVGPSNYHVSENIYTETEIGSSNFTTVATAINHIDFNVFQIGPDSTIDNFKIYLREIPLDSQSFTANLPYNLAGYTLVFSGTYKADILGWTGVDLTTSFVRTPGKNLMMLIERLDNVVHFIDANNRYQFRATLGNNNSNLLTTSRRVNPATAPIPGTTLLTTASTNRPQIQLRHLNANDAAVSTVYTLGKLPIPFATPHIVSANIINNGTVTLTNLDVSLNISGANTFSDLKTIPSIAPGASAIVAFNGFSPTVPGNNTVTVSLPPDDFPGDNSLAVLQEVSTNAYSYAYGTTPSGAVGITGGNTGDLVAKFVTSSPTSVNQVGVRFATGGQPFKIGIWDKSGLGVPGALLWESDPQITTAGIFTLPVNPVVAITDTFYVGVRQTGTVNVQFAYQNETPIRSNTFFSAGPTGSGAWVDFAPGNPFKFMIEPRLTLANDVGIAAIINPIAATSVDNCGIVPQATVANFGSNNQVTPFNVTFKINQAGNTVYTDTKTISLNSGVSQDLSFAAFGGSITGSDSAFCFTSLSTDGATNNDTLFNTFTTNNYSYGGGAAANGGYLFANSTACASPATFQPTYNWIAETSNEINWGTNGDDSVLTTPISLPFAFPYFGTNYSQFWISSNGWISFSNPAALSKAVQKTPVTIPAAGGIENYIAGALTDFDITTATYANAHTYYGGDATQFVITFSHAHLAGSATDFISFQIILKADGNIFIQYNDTETSVPVPLSIINSCSVGIENANGTQGIDYRRNANFGPMFGSPLAVQFKPPFTSPVLLSSFMVQRNATVNKLTWSTSQEINSSYFEIERSNNGRSFTPVGQVRAAGNSNSERSYSFTDPAPVRGINYYRLRMTDINNLVKYGPVKNVRNEGTATVEIFPNPVKDRLTINITSDRTDRGLITITDASGKTVFTSSAAISEGINNLMINVREFSAGTYIVKIQLKDDLIVTKLNKR